MIHRTNITRKLNILALDFLDTWPSNIGLLALLGHLDDFQILDIWILGIFVKGGNSPITPILISQSRNPDTLYGVLYPKYNIYEKYSDTVSKEPKGYLSFLFSQKASQKGSEFFL